MPSCRTEIYIDLISEGKKGEHTKQNYFNIDDGSNPFIRSHSLIWELFSLLLLALVAVGGGGSGGGGGGGVIVVVVVVWAHFLFSRSMHIHDIMRKLFFPPILKQRTFY